MTATWLRLRKRSAVLRHVSPAGENYHNTNWNGTEDDRFVGRNFRLCITLCRLQDSISSVFVRQRSFAQFQKANRSDARRVEDRRSLALDLLMAQEFREAEELSERTQNLAPILHGVRRHYAKALRRNVQRGIELRGQVLKRDEPRQLNECVFAKMRQYSLT